VYVGTLDQELEFVARKNIPDKLLLAHHAKRF